MLIYHTFILSKDTLDNKEETITTHRLIVDAIEAHDPLAAFDAMTMHILHNRNSMKSLFGDKNDVPANI
jgi:DNA-binding GntR family transcriptional regulator